MDKLKAIKTIRTWLRPSKPVITTTDEGLYSHTCKLQSAADRFVETVTALSGEIINQEINDQIEIVTIAKLPSVVIPLITPGPWGGSKPGSSRRKKDGGAIHKLDIRLTDKHASLLKALAMAMYSGDKSKTIRHLIEEAAQKEKVA